MPPYNDKRIVLRHTQGIYAGLHEIVGVMSQIKKDLAVADLPTVLGPLQVQPGTRKAQASLLRVKPRYVLYGEFWPAQMHRFGSPTGKDHFDPRQV